MANKQRRKNDTATTVRRKITDKSIRDNRIKNDDLTKERRIKADKLMVDHRLKNDEITINRREIRDGNPKMILTVFLMILIILVFLSYIILI